MATVRSRRLLGPVPLTTVPTSFGATPLDRTVVVRGLVFWHNDNVAHAVRGRLNGSSAGNIFFQSATIGAGAAVVLEVHWYFNPGDEGFWDVSGVAPLGICNLTLFGAILDGVPT